MAKINQYTAYTSPLNQSSFLDIDEYDGVSDYNTKKISVSSMVTELKTAGSIIDPFLKLDGTLATGAVSINEALPFNTTSNTNILNDTNSTFVFDINVNAVGDWFFSTEGSGDYSGAYQEVLPDFIDFYNLKGGFTTQGDFGSTYADVSMSVNSNTDFCSFLVGTITDTDYRVRVSINPYLDGDAGRTLNTVNAGVDNVILLGNALVGDKSDYTYIESLEIQGGNLIKTASSTPASAAASGITGQIEWDSNYIYVCVAANTWKRVAIATW